MLLIKFLAQNVDANRLPRTKIRWMALNNDVIPVKNWIEKSLRLPYLFQTTLDSVAIKFLITAKIFLYFQKKKKYFYCWFLFPVNERKKKLIKLCKLGVTLLKIYNISPHFAPEYRGVQKLFNFIKGGNFKIKFNGNWNRKVLIIHSFWKESSLRMIICRPDWYTAAWHE